MKVLVAQLCPTLCNPMDYSLSGSSVMEFSRQENRSGLTFSSPGDLPNPGIKPGLPLCKQILYHLSHQGNPNISESTVNSGLMWLDFVISYFSMKHQCEDICRPTLSTVLQHNLKNTFSIVLEVYKNSDQKKYHRRLE